MTKTEQKKVVPTDTGLGVRDLVTIGIMNAIYIAVYWTCGMILGTNPVTFPFITAALSIPAGIVIMLMLSRVPKRGTFAITGVVTGLVFLVTGHWWPMPVIMMITGGLTDLYYGAGNTRSFIRMTMAYVLFSIGFTVAAFGPLALFSQSYMAAMKADQYGMPKNYYDLALFLYKGPLFIAMLLLTALCAVLGALFGRAIMKKHFIKAGIV